jgi:hypothetical protein
MSQFGLSKRKSWLDKAIWTINTLCFKFQFKIIQGHVDFHLIYCDFDLHEEIVKNCFFCYLALWDFQRICLFDFWIFSYFSHSGSTSKNETGFCLIYIAFLFAQINQYFWNRSEILWQISVNLSCKGVRNNWRKQREKENAVCADFKSRSFRHINASCIKALR